MMMMASGVLVAAVMMSERSTTIAVAVERIDIDVVEIDELVDG